MYARRALSDRSHDARRRRRSPARRPVLVAVAALVAGVLGAIGVAIFSWYVVEPSDAEMLATASGLTPAGFVVGGEPGVMGKWAPSSDRGYVRMSASTEEVVTITAVREGLLALGWDAGEVTYGYAFDEVGASAEGLYASFTLRDAEVPFDGVPNEVGTRIELALYRGTSTAPLAATTLAMILAAGAGISLTLRLTRPSGPDRPRLRQRPPSSL